MLFTVSVIIWYETGQYNEYFICIVDTEGLVL